MATPRRPSLGQRSAVRPAGVAVDPLQPDRAIGHGRIELGGGRKASQAPFLLVPAEADDPARRRIGGRIGGDLRLRFGKAGGAAQIELQRQEAQFHHIAMGVDHAGDERAPFAVEPV